MSNEASYLFGQCTYYVARALDWVPSGWGNAADWWSHAGSAGFARTSIPTPGSVVVYGAGQGYSPYGHVAKVESVNGDGTFNVSEMNFNGWNQVDQRRSTMNDVLGFILPPGGKPDPAGSGGTSNPSFWDTFWSGFVSAIPGIAPLEGATGAGKTVGQLASNATKITGFFTDKRNWWKIFFVTGGSLLIIMGLYVYLIKQEEPELKALGKGAITAAA